MNASFIIISIIVFALLIAAIWAFAKRKQVKADAGRACLVRGYYYLMNGRNAEALAELKQATLDGHSSSEVYLIIAVLYRRKGELLKAIHLNEGLLMKGELERPAMGIVLRELVKCYRAADTLSKAEDWLAQLPSNVQDHEITLIRADLCSYKNDHESAIRKYKQYAKQSGKSTDKEIAREYIDIARLAGERTQKVKALKQALKHDADNINVYRELAELYFSKGKTAQAMRSIAQIIERDLILCKEDLRQLAELYFQHSSLDELEQLMVAKVMSHSAAVAPYIYLAESHVKKGHHERAIKLLQDYIEENGSKAVVLKHYAKLANDSVLLKIVQIDELYSCKVCGTKYKSYVYVCTKCGSLHSLDYI
ncbi:MAG: tetratricopeptide repeat protein [Deferribacteraceae bacterium]|jgi:lipopolysaccharide biosynthesis regulator YciM|nr:tetratricopeptide repeat protein [Deferribacteraceae bacterium]